MWGERLHADLQTNFAHSRESGNPERSLFGALNPRFPPSRSALRRTQTRRSSHGERRLGRGGERGKEGGMYPLKQPENPQNGPKLKVNLIWSRFSVTKSLFRSIGTQKITFCPHFIRFSDGFERYLRAPSDLESAGD